MTNTFLNKVQAERRVLAMVNKYTRNVRQLTGLSAAAIDDWQRRQGVNGIGVIVAQLRELAVACQALSDRSHETFGAVDSAAASAIETKCAELGSILERSMGEAGK